MNNARITASSTGHQVIVNGSDVTGSCRSIIWTASDGGAPPSLLIELMVSETTDASGDAVLLIDFGAAALLRKHGWTPPPGAGRTLPPVPQP